MIEKLSNYIPKNAIVPLQELLIKHPIDIKIVSERATKLGDFKRSFNQKIQITINNNLNSYQFLLTLIHEIAHFVTFKKYINVKPHGIEWKTNFQHLMLPFLSPDVFPLELLPILANYLKNPKASTGSDVNLTYALKQYDDNSGKSFIFEINNGQKFIYNGKTYKKIKLRRTRFECIELKSKKVYLFNQNAEIKKITNE